jgi:hypothetical protein
LLAYLSNNKEIQCQSHIPPVYSSRATASKV